METWGRLCGVVMPNHRAVGSLAGVFQTRMINIGIFVSNHQGQERLLSKMDAHSRVRDVWTCKLEKWLALPRELVRPETAAVTSGLDIMTARAQSQLKSHGQLRSYPSKLERRVTGCEASGGIDQRCVGSALRAQVL
jgi:hypothetical protein